MTKANTAEKMFFLVVAGLEFLSYGFDIIENIVKYI